MPEHGTVEHTRHTMSCFFDAMRETGHKPQHIREVLREFGFAPIEPNALEPTPQPLGGWPDAAPAAQPAALADIPDAELPGMWERADFMGGQDEVQPAASGVQLWDAIAELVVACGGSAADFPDDIVNKIESALTGAAKEVK